MFHTVAVWQVALLFAVGTIAGILNVLAGGGSLLTLPVLIFLGLPTAMANGTNRVGILIQNIVAVQGFRHRRMMPWRLALICTVPALAGSLLGAKLAIDVSDEAFRRILAGVMIGVYGGFIQAGVGFLIITGLLVQGLDMVRINAVKVFVVMVYTVAVAFAVRLFWR